MGVGRARGGMGWTVGPILGALAWCCFGSGPLGASGLPGDFLVDRWGTPEGLPQITVFAVAQDKDGYLWAGTEGGIARFDGERLEVFDRTNTPGLGSNIVRSIVPTEDGPVWFATRAGLARYRGGHFTFFTEAQGLVDNDVQTLFLDRRGELWIGTRSGLSRWADGRFENFTQAQGLSNVSVWAIAEDFQGRLWLGTEGGVLARGADGQFTAWTTDDGLSHAWIHTLHVDPAGTLLAGSFSGLDQFVEGTGPSDRGHFERSPWDSLLVHPTVRTLWTEGDTLWIGTDGGLHHVVGEQLTVFHQQNGFVGNHIRSLWRDRQGSLWVGTRYSGMARLRPRKVLALGEQEGLLDDLAWAILQDGSGATWVATNLGLSRVDSAGAIENFGADDGLPNDVFRSLYEDSLGRLWIGTLVSGMFRFAEGRFEPLPPLTASTVQPRINDFQEDSTGDMWVGTELGLFRVREGAVVGAFDDRDGLASNNIRDLEADGEGGLWLATTGGVSHLRDGRFTNYSRDQGLPIDPTLSLHLDDDAGLWIGTQGEGLVRLTTDGQIIVYPRIQGMFEVHRILDDGLGHFWMSSNQGIFRIDRDELLGLSNAEGALYRVTGFGVPEGMRSRECNGGSQPAGWLRTDGQLWFPSLAGVAIIDPDRMGGDVVKPQALIESVSVDGRRVDLESDGNFVPGTRVFEFEFIAPGFLPSDPIHYRYRLEGFDDDWLEGGDRRMARYTNLSPGDYRFRVMASSGRALDQATEASYAFRLRPFFYRTWTFYAVCVALLLLVGRSLHLLRLERMLKQQLRRSRIEMMEAKSAEIERFTFTVSHDLKSPLVTIRGFLGFLERDLEAGNMDRVHKDIGKIRHAATSMQRLLDDLLTVSRGGRVVRETETVDLGVLIHEAKEVVAGRITARGVAVEIADNLPKIQGDRPRLFQVFQNLIDNAVKFMGDEPQPRIWIGLDASSTARNPVIHVKDNGIGIEPQEKHRIFDLFGQLDADAEGAGMGLALVKRIIEAHGGRIWADSPGLGHGTTFFVSLPDRPTDVGALDGPG